MGKMYKNFSTTWSSRNYAIIRITDHPQSQRALLSSLGCYMRKSTYVTLFPQISELRHDQHTHNPRLKGLAERMWSTETAWPRQKRDATSSPHDHSNTFRHARDCLWFGKKNRINFMPRYVLPIFTPIMIITMPPCSK